MHARLRIFTDYLKIQGFPLNSRDSLEIYKIHEQIHGIHPRFTNSNTNSCQRYSERLKLRLEILNLNSLVVVNESICTKIYRHCFNCIKLIATILNDIKLEYVQLKM